jgi:hypothetical protein
VRKLSRVAVVLLITAIYHILSYVHPHLMSQPYSPSWFLNPSSEASLITSSSLESSITSSSIYTTTTSHTIPGIGSLSGKFIHGFGKTVLRGVENVTIRRRLSHIESLCPLSDKGPPVVLSRLYDDLLELARYVFARLNIDEAQ